MKGGTWRKIFSILALGCIGVLLQSSILKTIFPAIIVPNFLIMLVVFLAFYEDTTLGALLAFLVGLELDLSSGRLLGPSAGAFVVVFGILATMSQHIFVESFLTAAIVVFIASVISNLVYGALIYEYLGSWPLADLLVEALLSGLLAPLVIGLLQRILLSRERGTARRIR